jgi:hypothetical protein
VTLAEFEKKKKRRIKRIEAGHEPEEIALMKLFQANGQSF